MALSDIVESDLKWMDGANCIGRTEPFDRYETDRSYAEDADQMCASCPVVKECFEVGIKGEYGQWGGIYWAGNGRPDERANAHKSEDYIKYIQEMVE